MTGFEPGCSDIVGDHAVNCATTTAQQQQFVREKWVGHSWQCS